MGKYISWICIIQNAIKCSSFSWKSYFLQRLDWTHYFAMHWPLISLAAPWWTVTLHRLLWKEPALQCPMVLGYTLLNQVHMKSSSSIPQQYQSPPQSLKKASFRQPGNQDKANFWKHQQNYLQYAMVVSWVRAIILSASWDLAKNL